MSELAIGPTGWLMRVNLAVIGVALVVVAVSMAQVDSASWLAGASRWIAVAGLGFMVDAAFNVDPGGRLRTVHGAVHNAAAVLVFLAISVAALRACRAGATVVVSALPLGLTLPLMAATQIFRSDAGALQRVALVIVCSFMSVVGWHLARTGSPWRRIRSRAVS